MDQVQTSTLLHYRFDGSIEGLWRCTPKVIFFDCLFSGPEQMTHCESIHARQPQESLETTVGWASLRRVRKNKGIVPKVLLKNRFMSVVFNTRMSWWGSQHIDITVDVPTPPPFADLTIQGSSAGTPQVFNLSHKEFANISKKAWLCKSWRETNPSNSALRNLQTTTEDHKVDLPWWIASLQDNLGLHALPTVLGALWRVQTPQFARIAGCTKWFDLLERQKRDPKRLTVKSSTYKFGNKYLGILWNFDICWSSLTRWGVMVRGQHCNFKFPQPRSRTVDSTTLPDVRGKTLLRTAIIAKALRCQRINKQKDAPMPIQSTVSDEDFGEDSDFLKLLQQITTEHVQLIPAACFLWWPYSSPSQQTDVQAAHKNAQANCYHPRGPKNQTV